MLNLLQIKVRLIINLLTSRLPLTSHMSNYITTSSINNTNTSSCTNRLDTSQLLERSYLKLCLLLIINLLTSRLPLTSHMSNYITTSFINNTNTSSCTNRLDISQLLERSYLKLCLFININIIWWAISIRFKKQQLDFLHLQLLYEQMVV